MVIQEKSEMMAEPMAWKKKVFLRVAWAFLGTPYRWGGDDPMAGFDCSGFVIECLKSVGLLSREGDWTAHQLIKMFAGQVVPEPEEGAIVFFWNREGTKVIHTEICLDNELAIGASGGGSNTGTNQDAIDQNAYIKIRPIEGRSGSKSYVQLFAP